jgi:beta-1,4-N-acetylglucosaminyltransferase
MDSGGRSVFVTVGTTRFDKLMEVIDTVEFQTLARDRLGASLLRVQCGNSSVLPESRVPGLSVESFGFAPALTDFIRAADVIITHCGAGTILEILRMDKPAIAVVNDNLLDNHQTELAQAMFRNEYMFVADRPGILTRTIESIDWASRKPYPPGDPRPFTRSVHALLDIGD